MFRRLFLKLAAISPGLFPLMIDSARAGAKMPRQPGDASDTGSAQEARQFDNLLYRIEEALRDGGTIAIWERWEPRWERPWPPSTETPDKGDPLAVGKLSSAPLKTLDEHTLRLTSPWTLHGRRTGIPGYMRLYGGDGECCYQDAVSSVPYGDGLCIQCMDGLLFASSEVRIHNFELTWNIEGRFPRCSRPGELRK